MRTININMNTVKFFNEGWIKLEYDDGHKLFLDPHKLIHILD